MHAPDPELPRLITRARALSAGMTEGQVDRRIASGEWEVVRRGWFRLADRAPAPATSSVARAAPGRGSEQTPGQAAAALMAAARALPGRELVASHLSAARIWGFAAPLPQEHLSERPGLSITTAARTVADCLRVLPAHDGLAMLDQALRLRLVTLAQVEATVRFQAGWQGVRTARIRAAGADVQRWGAADILDRHRREALGVRLHSALTQAARFPRFTGRATPT